MSIALSLSNSPFLVTTFICPPLLRSAPPHVRYSPTYAFFFFFLTARLLTWITLHVKKHRSSIDLFQIDILSIICEHLVLHSSCLPRSSSQSYSSTTDREKLNTTRLQYQEKTKLHQNYTCVSLTSYRVLLRSPCSRKPYPEMRDRLPTANTSIHIGDRSRLKRESFASRQEPQESSRDRLHPAEQPARPTATKQVQRCGRVGEEELAEEEQMRKTT